MARRRRVNTRFLLSLILSVIGLCAIGGVIYYEKVLHQNPKRFIASALRMEHDQNFEQAELDFKGAIRADPKDAQTLVMLGDMYREWANTNDDIANSGKDVASYVNALQIDPDNIDALTKVMTVYVEQVEFRHRAEDFDGLKEMATKIVQLHPQDSDLYHRAQAYAAIAPLARWLSGIAVTTEEVDDDIKALADLMKENDFNPDVPYYLAQSYLNKAMEKRRGGQDLEAKAAAQHYFDEARSVFEQAIVLRPQSPRLLMRFYMLLGQANQKLQSDEDLREAREYLPRMDEVLTKARKLVDDAADLAAKIRKGGKEPELEFTDSENKTLTDAQKDARKKAFKEAWREVQKEDKESYTDVYYHSVEFAGRHTDMGLGKDEAMRLAKKWLEVRPGDQTARLMVAGLLEAENQPAERAQAIALLEQPITDAGGAGIGVLRSRKSLDLSTKLRLINLLIEQWGLTTDAAAQTSIRQKIDNAFDQFSKIVSPISYDSKKLEGRIQLQTGGVEGAIKAVSLLNQAETIRQQAGVQDLELDWWLAQAYERTQQTGKAEERLAKICGTREKFAPAHILYAKLLLKDGKLFEAGREVATLKKLDPDNPQVKDLEIQCLMRMPNDPEAKKLIPGLIAPFETNATKEQVMAIANAFLVIGEVDHAVTTLESARLTTPGDFDIVQMLVSIYLRQAQAASTEELKKQHRESARKVVDEATRAAPDNANFKILKLSLDAAANEKLTPAQRDAINEKIRAAQREAIGQIKDELTREMRFFDYELTLGDYPAALQHLDNAEKIKPDDKSVLEVRFRVSCQLRQWDKAEAVVKMATAHDLDEAGGRIYEFRLAMARGDINKALVVARDLVHHMPNFARPHLCLAQALQANSQFDAAIGEYKSAREAQDSAEALTGMISCYYALNQPSEALSCIKHGLQINPNDANFKEQEIQHYLSYGDPKTAVPAREQQWTADKDHVLTWLNLATAYFQVAQVDRKNGGKDQECKDYWNKAQQRLLEAKQIWPDEVRIYQLLLNLQFFNHDFPGGQQVLTALAARPNFKNISYPWLLMADHALRFGKTAEAEAAYKTALEKSQNGADEQVKLSNFYRNLGRYDEAVKVLDASSTDRRVQIELAQALVLDKKLDNAEKLMQKLVAANANDAEFQAILGFVFYSEGNATAAIAAFNKSLDINKNNSRALFFRGLIYLRQKNPDLERAERDLTAARDLDPTDADIHRSLAQTLHLRGKKEEVVREMEKAVQLIPGDKNLRLQLIEAYGQQTPPRSVDQEHAIHEAEQIEAWRNDPDWPRAEAKMWVARGQFDKALACIADAMRMQRLIKDPQQQQALGTELLHDQLNVMQLGKKWIDLENTCTQYLEQNPVLAKQAWWLYQARAVARRWLDKKELALRDYDTAIQIAGATDDEDALSFIVFNLESTLGVDTALAYARHYAEADMHWRILCACLALHKNDVQDAVAEIETVLDQAKKLTPEQLDVANEQAGKIYVIAEQYDKAKMVYQSMLQRHPDDLFANNNLAAILSEKQSPPDLERARMYGDAAMKIMQSSGQDNASILDTEGYILLQTGHLDDAIGLLKRAVSMTPTPSRCYHLGLALMKKGLPGEALLCFQKAKDLLMDPKTPKTAPNTELGPKINLAIDEARKAAQTTGSVNP